jgi:hypothetical protein
MRADGTGQTASFAAYASCTPAQQRAAHAPQSSSVADMLVAIVWSGTGLALSVLFMLLPGNAMVADDAFNFLVGVLG